MTIGLLETLATTTELKTFLASFVRTKIDGRAREYLSDTDNTTKLIITSLKKNIKPDSSKVIEGRMLSLRLNASNQAEFSEKAESTAEALRRSLIIEGMTPIKATEIAVDKTIELCRNNARTDLVKSVLEATAYESPKEVIAKLLTQMDKARKENQILSFKTTPKRFNSNKPGGQPQNHQQRFNHSHQNNNNPRYFNNNNNRNNNNNFNRRN